MTEEEEIQTNKEKHILLSALEFFVDYKYSTGKWMNNQYINKINQIEHNDFAKLCKRMGGKTRFEPTIDKETK